MDSNVESKITKYGLRLTVLLVLMLPYSYQHWLDTGYDVTRIVAWLWEYFYATNPDPRFDDVIRFIPIPTTLISFAPILYIPTFYLLKVFHDYLDCRTSTRKIYILSLVAMLCPYLGYLFPPLVGYSVDYFISFPVGPIVVSILTWYHSKDERTQQDITSPWIETPSSNI